MKSTFEDELRTVLLQEYGFKSKQCSTGRLDKTI